MNNEEKDIPVDETSQSTNETNELDSINRAINGEASQSNLENLQDDIIRNDTIPETSRDTPGSSGAFPVGAFDTSKD